LGRLPGWIETWADPNLSADISFAIQLCLEEAVANIIMYGSGRDDQGEIAIEVRRNGGALVARIEDTGREFDPTRVPPPLLASSLEQAKVGAFGIPLMRSFASSMNYTGRAGGTPWLLARSERPTQKALGGLQHLSWPRSLRKIECLGEHR
jgi:serine/threonine-protein kinase RsbW